MPLAIHRPSLLMDRRQAQYVVGTLGLLIDVVKDDPLLGDILNQARNEVVTLLADQSQRSQLPQNEAA